MTLITRMGQTWKFDQLRPLIGFSVILCGVSPIRGISVIRGQNPGLRTCFQNRANSTRIASGEIARNFPTDVARARRASLHFFAEGTEVSLQGGDPGSRESAESS